MNNENLKKLIVPFIVFLGLLAINANSIINGINQHQTSRVVIASASSVIIIVVFVIVLLRVKNNGKKPTE